MGALAESLSNYDMLPILVNEKRSTQNLKPFTLKFCKKHSNACT